GAAWGAVPGVLRAFTGAHEVINTIMMNFLAGALGMWIGNTFAFAPETTHTTAVAPGAVLPALRLGGSAANASVFLAVIAAAGVWWVLERTRPGFELRAFGASPTAAENAGIAPRRTIVVALAAAGGLAGLVGANFVLGYKHYFEEGMSRGTGFMGIAVALLGRGHP